MMMMMMTSGRLRRCQLRKVSTPFGSHWPPPSTKPRRPFLLLFIFTSCLRPATTVWWAWNRKRLMVFFFTRRALSSSNMFFFFVGNHRLYLQLHYILGWQCWHLIIWCRCGAVVVSISLAQEQSSGNFEDKSASAFIRHPPPPRISHITATLPNPHITATIPPTFSQKLPPHHQHNRKPKHLAINVVTSQCKNFNYLKLESIYLSFFPRYCILHLPSGLPVFSLIKDCQGSPIP